MYHLLPRKHINALLKLDSKKLSYSLFRPGQSLIREQLVRDDDVLLKLNTSRNRNQPAVNVIPELLDAEGLAEKFATEGFTAKVLSRLARRNANPLPCFILTQKTLRFDPIVAQRWLVIHLKKAARRQRKAHG